MRLKVCLLVPLLCSGVTFAETADLGVGPAQEVKLEAVNPAMAKDGKVIFSAKCSACHKMSERYVGPALKDVTKRRAPQWILNMILNPAEMLQKNATAQELLAEYLTPMTFQNVSADEARKLLEYFRHYDELGDLPGEPNKTETKSSKKKK